MEIVNYILTNSDTLITAALAVIGAASAVAAVFGKSDNKYIEYARKIVNFAALNISKAKNKE
jgi:hypothetical protein